MNLPRKLASEAIGTMLLLAVVIGPGIMAERLAGGKMAIALLANTLATVGGLYVLLEQGPCEDGQLVAEAVATAGLLLFILRAPAGRAAPMVAVYIGAAYWFKASTSFANAAAVFGRMFSDSFAVIAPRRAFGFVIAQLVGAGIGAGVHCTLRERTLLDSPRNVVEAAGKPNRTSVD